VRRADRLLYLCTRQELLPEHREALERLAEREPVDWPRVVSRAREGGVLPIVATGLRRCDPARLRLRDEERAGLELAVLESVALSQGQEHRLAAVLGRLRAVGLDAMLLKSSALALDVYAEPWVAVARDIDLALRPGPGWVEGEGGEREVRADLYPQGVECDLGAHHDVTMDGVLPVDFERIWREARPLRFHGVPAWAMSAEDLLLSLCVNACRKRYFRLKCLFDVAETLRRGGPFDATRLGTLARRQRCAGIVAAALLAVRATVGAPLAGELLDALRLPRWRRRLLGALAAAVARWGALDSPAGRGLAGLLVLASLHPGDALRALLLVPRQRLRTRTKRRKERRGLTPRA
jgi:hypothetical protein